MTKQTFNHLETRRSFGEHPRAFGGQSFWPRGRRVHQYQEREQALGCKP